jgi:carboxyl-terminal processing protease
MVRLVSVLAAVGGVAVSFGAGYVISQHASPSSQQSAQTAPNIVGAVRTELETRYVRDLGDSVLAARSIDGLIDRLHDPYTVYLTPSEYASVRAAVATSEVGVGLRVAPAQGMLRVIGAADGSPAARLGIRRGDAIVAIDGVSTQGLRFDDALARLQGVSGTALKLRIERGPDADPLDFRMVRVRLHPDAVSSYVAGTGAARVRVIRIRSFAHGVAREVQRLIDDHTPLVLDLRGDPGGLLQEAARTADLFLSSGPIVTWRGAHLALHVLDAHPGDDSAARVVVLVDRQTASAAEVLTAALQDHRRATVVGTRTFGKSTVQAIDPLVGGGALKLTIANYRTPLGHDLHAHGVRPNVPGGPHPLARAIAIARG